MSEEAVDLSRAAFEQFSRGDFSAYADLPDDFELILAPEMPDAGTYKGAMAREWLTTWVDSFDRLTYEPVDFTDVGNDRVLIEFVQRSRSGGSDVPVELPTWSLATVRNGNLIRAQLFQNRSAALEAAGLKE